MESLIAGRFALERRTPFAILRAVADPADRDLPPLVLSAVDSDGRIKAAAVAAEGLSALPASSPGSSPPLATAAPRSGR